MDVPKTELHRLYDSNLKEFIAETLDEWGSVRDSHEPDGTGLCGKCLRVYPCSERKRAETTYNYWSARALELLDKQPGDR